MAVTTYEVGALFTIVNRASPVLLKVAEQLAAIDKQIAGLGTGASDMTAGMALAFGKVTESAASALGSMRALKTEMAEIAASSQAVGRLVALRRWHQAMGNRSWRRQAASFHRPRM